MAGKRSFQSYFMNGTFTSSGIYHGISPAGRAKNSYKNAYNTDVARERGLEKETEDWGHIE